MVLDLSKCKVEAVAISQLDISSYIMLTLWCTPIFGEVSNYFQLMGVKQCLTAIFALGPHSLLIQPW